MGGQAAKKHCYRDCIGIYRDYVGAIGYNIGVIWEQWKKTWKLRERERERDTYIYIYVAPLMSAIHR